jgi:competence protein ComEA
VLCSPKIRSALIAAAFLLTSRTAFAAPKALQLPDGPGKATMQRICSGCHAPEIVIGRHETKEAWEQIVSSMVDKGANGTDDEFNTIIGYLAANFPKKADSKPADDSGGKNP